MAFSVRPVKASADRAGVAERYPIMRSVRYPPWHELAPTLKPHELPVLPGSPATPEHPLARHVAYGVVSLLLVLTGSLGAAAISANIVEVQGALGVTAVEAAWLPIAYTMTNACMGLIMVRFRIQYGLQLFTRIFLLALLAVSVGNLFANDFTSAIAVRAVAGVAASGLSTLGFLYMIQAFPAPQRLKALVFGIGASSFAVPLGRLIVPPLLQLGGWQAFNLFELGLALLSLVTVVLLPLPPSERRKAFAPLDLVTFALFAPGIALLSAVLGLGRLVWWTEAAWIGWALAGAIALLAAAAAIELNRENPLISLKFLSGSFIYRLALSLLLVRIVLSEQSTGAVGFLQQMGLVPAQLHGMFWMVLVGTAAGLLVSAFTLNPAKLGLPIAVALALVAVGAWIDSHATAQTRPVNLYFSQFLLAFAAALFIGPAMIAGISQVRAQGPQYMVSFMVVFQVGQNLGGLAGSALVGSVETLRQRFHYSILSQGMTLADPAVATRAQQLAGAYAGVIPDPQRRAIEGLRLLFQQITQQSHVLAYNDVFLMLALVASLGSAWVTFHYVRRRLPARPAVIPSPHAPLRPDS